MTQLALFDLPSSSSSPPVWRRIDSGRDRRGRRSKCDAVWQLGELEYYIKHCGHPTANWPLYGELPDGRIVMSRGIGPGLGFAHLADAQAMMEHLAREAGDL